ncbi:MAG: hypothetical protein VYA30_00235 [Myxococcota bacterium]|nr:hypothetical protein [Myxococcota bacterium]
MLNVKRLQICLLGLFVLGCSKTSTTPESSSESDSVSKAKTADPIVEKNKKRAGATRIKITSKPAPEHKHGDEAEDEDEDHKEHEEITPPEELMGLWVLDADAVKSSQQFKMIPEDKRKNAELVLSKSDVSLTLTKETIKVQGRFLGRAQDEVVSYKITGREGNNLVVETLIDGEKRVQHFLQKDKKLIVRTAGQPMFFKRKPSN